MNKNRQTGSKWIVFVWLQNFSIIIYVRICVPDINVFAFSAVFFTPSIKILIFGSVSAVNSYSNSHTTYF
jgi:hypothetical protein